MPDPHGDLLYVNVGASEARRRLKGFGHGVKKVQSAGRNRAVVIHVASGRHLAELERKFADVGVSRRASDLPESIENLRNLGSASAAWLREVGILTVADLQRLGAALAFRVVRRVRPEASWNLLWALAAGLEERDWRSLTPAEKQRLREAVEGLG